MRFAFYCFIFLSCLPAGASTKVLDVGLFSKQEPGEIIVSPEIGSYTVLGNGLQIMELKKGEKLRLKSENGLVTISSLKVRIGQYAEVRLERKIWGSTMIIQRVDQAYKSHEYHDDFRISAKGKKLKVINHVYLEHYVSGVVESEAGSREPKEYYKVQSVICRTYALNNRNRHAAEGFEVCDQVHCQVYHNKSRHNPDIIKGTQETIGIVIVDSDINLVTAAFYSNCGGYTCNSEDVWSGALSYLREREDDYCLEEPHAYWRYTTTTAEWLSYLKRRFDYPINDSLARDQALHYCPERRFHRLNDSIAWVDFKTIRKDLKLRSAYFNIDQVADSIIIEGRGYGHGVGLCQEGAMNQAKRGVPFDEILHYYYAGIHLVNLSVIEFFRSE